MDTAAIAMLVGAQCFCEFVFLQFVDYSHSITSSISSFCASEQYENSIPINSMLANQTFHITMPEERHECRHGGHIILNELIVSEDDKKASAVEPHQSKRGIAELKPVGFYDGG